MFWNDTIHILHMSSYSSSIVSMARPYLASFPRYSERLVENRDFSYSVCTSPGGGRLRIFSRSIFCSRGEPDGWATMWWKLLASYLTSKPWVRDQLRSLKMVSFETLCTISYSHHIATMAISLAFSTQYANVTDARRTDRHRTTA